MECVENLSKIQIILTIKLSIGSSFIKFKFISDNSPFNPCVSTQRWNNSKHSYDEPCVTTAWMAFVPFSRRVWAARVKVDPVSTISSTRIATYRKTRIACRALCEIVPRLLNLITLSATSPTRISIDSGVDKDLPFRLRWTNANSIPSLSAKAVTLEYQ